MLYFLRPVKDICGFSRETVIAVTTNIESMEFRRRQIGDIGYEEHPRTGTTDNVEAIIAFLHRILELSLPLNSSKLVGNKWWGWYAPYTTLLSYHMVNFQQVSMGETIVAQNKVAWRDIISCPIPTWGEGPDDEWISYKLQCISKQVFHFWMPCIIFITFIVDLLFASESSASVWQQTCHFTTGP